MKTVILALFVLLAVSQSEALKCNCGGLNKCSSPVETCYRSSDSCVTVIMYDESRPNFFKGCISSDLCTFMNRPGKSSSSCCRGDQCN
uniref:Uncharacterized protein n=1 Tax=Dicentrarchus labrax TaxID=13489 RepID=A0A8C4ELN5_DICLA